jgi:hypothetical protein
MARTRGKKAVKKAAAKPKKAAVKSIQGGKSVDLKKLREQIVKQVADKMKSMTDAISDEAAKGHLAQFRYLLELIGLYPATPGEKPGLPDSDDLAQELLKHFDFPNRPPKEENETEDVTSAAGASNSVE